MHDAPLPGCTLEDLGDGLDESGVVIGDHALDAGDAPSAQVLQERLPRCGRLGIDDIKADEAPGTVLSGCDCSYHAFGLHVALVTAVEVGGIELQVGKGYHQKRSALSAATSSSSSAVMREIREGLRLANPCSRKSARRSNHNQTS